MGRILADDFILVVGDGATYMRQDLLDSAKGGRTRYEQQDEDAGTQTVRVRGDAKP